MADDIREPQSATESEFDATSLPSLRHPWLVAVWPGMGGVAANAGIYLLSKLDMEVIAEFEAAELFDIDHVEVKNGIIQPVRRPRNRFFKWTDPKGQRDIVVFLGEAQPPLGKYPFCRQLVAFAKRIGVERVLTFAAMATQMRPEDPSRVFAAATDQANLEELKRLELEVLEEGNVGGLNGVLLGAAAEAGLEGACLLGEMPHLFAQLPFPKASVAVLEAFATMAGIEIDLSELGEQAHEVEEQLEQILEKVEEAVGEKPEFPEEPEPPKPLPPKQRTLTPAESAKVEELFAEAGKDRTRATELKKELDRLEVFKRFENRFLDLFRKPEQS